MPTEEIHVRLPLSSATVKRLMDAVGAKWPGARVRTDRHGDTMMLVMEVESEVDDIRSGTEAVPISEARVGEDGAIIAPLSSDEITTFLTSVRDGSFGMSMPEWYSKMMVGVFHDIVGDAPNYVEQSLGLKDPDTGRYETWTVTVGKPGGKTPHELRSAAEAEVESLKALLRRVRADRPSAHTDDLWEAINAALD